MGSPPLRMAGNSERYHAVTKAIKTRTAVVAVGTSTARGQGAPGVVGALRTALDAVPIARFSKARQSSFASSLEASTQMVMATLPRPTE